MLFRLRARGSGKSYMVICERIAELQSRIEFAKKFGLDYTEDKKELDRLLSNMEGGNTNVRKHRE